MANFPIQPADKATYNDSDNIQYIYNAIENYWKRNTIIGSGGTTPPPAGGGTPAGSNSFGIDVQGNVNVLKNSFRTAEALNKPSYQQQNMFIDAYTDATGIDAAKSTNYAVSSGFVEVLYTNVVGGANAGTAISSPPVNGSYPASNAFDGNTATTFGSTERTDTYQLSWIGWDFGAGVTKHIRRLRTFIANVTSVLVQYSDDVSTWTTVGTYTINVGAWFQFDIPATAPHRAWRVMSNAHVGPFDVGEIQMFTAPTTSGIVVTTQVAAPNQPQKMIIDAEVTGAVTFDLSLDDGVTWTSGIATDKLIDVSTTTGLKIRMRANIPAGGSVQSLGFTWYDTNSLPVGVGAPGGTPVGTNAPGIDVQANVNSLKNSFRNAEALNKVAYQQQNMFIDAYTDVSGIDLVKSTRAYSDGRSGIPVLDYDTFSGTTLGTGWTASSATTSVANNKLTLGSAASTVGSATRSTPGAYTKKIIAQVDITWGSGSEAWLYVGASTSAPLLRIGLTGGNTVALQYLPAGGGTTSLYSATIDVTKVHTLAISYDPTNGSTIAYVDGVQVYSGTQPIMSSVSPIFAVWGNGLASSHTFSNFIVKDPNNQTTAILITTQVLAPLQPQKLIIDAEVTGAITFDLSLDDGVTWTTNVRLDSLIDVSAITGTKIRMRANIPAGGSVQSLGFTWYDANSIPIGVTSSASNTFGIDVQSNINTLRNAYRSAETANKAAYQQQNMYIDAYNDVTGFDAAKSFSYLFDSTNKQVVTKPSVVQGITGYTYSVAPATQYPDLGPTAKLTDGVLGTTAYADGKWIGINQAAGALETITFTLPSAATIANAQVNIGSSTSSSIYYPTNITVKGSNDNTTWTQIGTLNPGLADQASSLNNIVSANVIVSTTGAAAYKYYQVTFTQGAGWMFLSEIQLTSTISPVIVTNTITAPLQPQKMILDAEITGAVTFDLSCDDGTTWTTNVATDKLIDVSAIVGTKIRVRINIPVGGTITSLGFTWYDANSMPLTPSATGGSSFIDVQASINILKSSYRSAETAAKPAYKQQNMFVDVYTDASGLDNVKSSPYNLAGGQIYGGLVNIAGKMTSDTAPAPYKVTYSDVYQAIYGYNAFDRTLGTVWHSGASGLHWIAMEFPTAQVCQGYSITASNNTSHSNSGPVQWDFQGSNDGGTTWVNIESKTAQVNFAIGEKRSFKTANATAYKMYRLANMQGGGYAGGTYTLIDEIEFMQAQAVTIYTSPVAAPIAVKKIVIVPENTGAPSYNLSLDGGTTWKAGLASNTLIDVSDLTGTQIVFRFDLPDGNAAIQSFGYIWYDANSLVSVGGTTLDPAYGSMILNDTVNLLKSNFRSAETRNVGKYTWRSMAIDAYNDATGIDAAKSTGYAVSGGQVTSAGTVSIIPAMTASNAPAGYVANASSSYNATSQAWAAFDKAISSWIPNGPGVMGWISIQMPAGQTVTQYAITSQDPSQTGTSWTSAQRAPKAWTFEGSQDGTAWTVLDTQTNFTGWAAGNVKATRSFLVSNAIAYKYYRLNVTANNGGDFLCIDQIDLFGNDTNATVVTTSDTAIVQPTKIVIDAETIGTVTFDVSLDDGVNWITGITLDSFIDVSAKAGTKVRIRANISAGGGVQSLGYSWFDNSIALGGASSGVDPGTLSRLLTAEINLLKTNFRVAAIQSASKYGMKNMVIDNYNDQTGINASASSGYTYDATNKLLKLSGVGPVITPNNMTANTSVGFVASANAETDGAAYLAFDGSAATHWGWAAGTTGWLQIDLGTAKAPGQYTLTSRSDAWSTQTPSAWTFLGSNDGTTWTTLDTRSAQTGWGLGATRTYQVTGAAYRYYRLNMTAVDGATTISLAEFQIYGAATGNALIVSTADTAAAAPSKMVLSSAYTLPATADTIKFELSRDGGTTWTVVTPDVLTDISTQPVGTSVVSRVTLTGGTTIKSIGYSWS